MAALHGAIPMQIIPGGAAWLSCCPGFVEARLKMWHEPRAPVSKAADSGSPRGTQCPVGERTSRPLCRWARQRDHRAFAACRWWNRPLGKPAGRKGKPERAIKRFLPPLHCAVPYAAAAQCRSRWLCSPEGPVYPQPCLHALWTPRQRELQGPLTGRCRHRPPEWRSGSIVAT